MLQGQTLLTGSEYTYYGPWIPRRGNEAVFAAEAIAISSNGASLSIAVEHKNFGDADSTATTIATIPSLTTIGTASVLASNLKEVVRFKYTASNSVSQPTWIHFQMLHPVWAYN